MALRNIFFGLLAAAPAFADNHCGTHIDGPVVGSVVPRSSRLSKRQATAPAPPTVPLYVHVVAASKDRKDGYLTEDEVIHQVELIQAAYKPHGISFKHDKSMRQWVENAGWSGDNQDFSEMKAALHKGDYRTLNLYIRHVTTADYGGTCTNPWTHEEIYHTPFPERLIQDGCVINDITIDGSSHRYMNMGKTAIHEIGHWFGLHHPHEGGTVRNGVNPVDTCWEGNPDDYVADTGKMKNVPAGGCNRTANTCPEPAGKPIIYDPVDNYMSYSADSCMDKFTTGQKERMYEMYDKYRKNVS